MKRQAIITILHRKDIYKNFHKNESSLSNKPFGIGLTTDKVEETVNIAENAGRTILEQLKTKPWGKVLAYLRDIDGFLIEICTPMS